MQALRKFALAALLGSALAAQAAVQVGVDPSKNWIGFMNWFNMPAEGGAFDGQGFWAPADLGSEFSGSTLTLTPNTSLDRDRPTDPYWWKPDGSSNKVMGANLFVLDDTLVGQSIVFSGRVLSNTLAPGYKSSAFIRSFNADFSVLLSSIEVVLQDGMAFQVAYQSGGADRHIEYGFDTIGPNARIGNDFGSVVIATVPEPAAWTLLALSLLAATAVRRSRRELAVPAAA
jgi:hypothetical protein